MATPAPKHRDLSPIMEADLLSRSGGNLPSCHDDDATANDDNDTKTPLRQREPLSPLSDVNATLEKPTRITNSHQLWACWEMWCDIPAPRGKGGLGARGFSSGKKGALQQPTVCTWLDMLRSVGVFDTAEGFWGVHNCTVQPSHLPLGGNYYCLRRNIPPMWEHEANRRGGKWTLHLAPDEAAVADNGWLQLCLAAIGERFPGDETELCGVTVARRKAGFRLSVWTRNATDQVAQTRIGLFVKELLGLSATSIAYTEHCQALTSGAGSRSPTSPLSPTASPGRPASPEDAFAASPPPPVASSPTVAGPPAALYRL